MGLKFIRLKTKDKTPATPLVESGSVMVEGGGTLKEKLQDILQSLQSLLSSLSDKADKSELANLDTKVNTKADDSKVVHNTGNETISGKKYFNNEVSIGKAKLSSTATTSPKRTTLKIEGVVSSYPASILVQRDPTENLEVATKQYVDEHSASGAVLTTEQSLSETQKGQARTNIDVPSVTEMNNKVESEIGNINALLGTI